MLYTSDQIRARLADRNLRQVAERAGVGYHALWRVMAGKQIADETMLARLTEYLDGGGSA